MVQGPLHLSTMAAADDDDRVNVSVRNVARLSNVIKMMIVLVNYDSEPSKVLDLKLNVRNLLCNLMVGNL